MRMPTTLECVAMAGGEHILRLQYERKIMKLHVDKESDALYLRIDDSAIVESEEVSPGVVLDYNEANEVVGVEMLNLPQSNDSRSGARP